MGKRLSSDRRNQRWTPDDPSTPRGQDHNRAARPMPSSRLFRPAPKLRLPARFVFQHRLLVPLAR